MDRTDWWRRIGVQLAAPLADDELGDHPADRDVLVVVHRRVRLDGSLLGAERP
jgi:hypothetical protein